MSELNVSLINEKQFPKNSYNKSWALQQNLFKNLEPDIIENNSEDDFVNNFDFFKSESKKNMFSHKDAHKLDHIREDIEFSFYDNLLIKYTEENKKLSINKKKTHKRKESKLSHNEKENKEVKMKKSQDKRIKIETNQNEILIRAPPSPKKEIIFKKEIKDEKGLKDLKVYFKLPHIQLEKTISNDTINTGKNEIEKSHITVINPTPTNRKQSTSQNIPSQERYNHFFEKEILDVAEKYRPSRFKKDNFQSKSNTKKVESKEKKTPKQSGLSKNAKQCSMLVGKENIVASVQPIKISKKTVNSECKNNYTADLNGYSVYKEENNLVIVATDKEEKKKKKSFFNSIFCLPFCSK